MRYKIKIHLAKRKDRTGIFNVAEKSLPINYTLDEWGEMISEKNSFVLEASGEIVGYIICNSMACIVSFAILKEFRGNGYGKLLLHECLDNLKKNKYKKVVLRVQTNNEIAQKLYVSTGFKIVEKIAGYYKNLDNSDAFLMTLEF